MCKNTRDCIKVPQRDGRRRVKANVIPAGVDGAVVGEVAVVG